MKGADWDIDRSLVSVAYILYWDAEHRIISEQTMYQETLYPLSLIDAIQVFAPEMAAGANVTFAYPDGTLTKLTVFEF